MQVFQASVCHAGLRLPARPRGEFGRAHGARGRDRAEPHLEARAQGQLPRGRPRRRRRRQRQPAGRRLMLAQLS